MIERCQMGYRYFLLLFLVGISSFFVYQFLSTVGVVRYVTFSFDQNLSSRLCRVMKDEITCFEAERAYNPQLIIDTFRDHFPIVQSIEIKQLPQHVAHVKIKAFEPLIRINNNQLLVKNQTIVNIEYYNPDKIALLPHITIAEPIPLSINQSVMTAIEQCIVEKIFDRYHLHIATLHEWHLCCIDDPSFIICCNAESLLVDAFPITYDRLKRQVQKKHTVEKWIADIRFRDQIILAKSKGGGNG